MVRLNAPARAMCFVLFCVFPFKLFVLASAGSKMAFSESSLVWFFLLWWGRWFVSANAWFIAFLLCSNVLCDRPFSSAAAAWFYILSTFFIDIFTTIYINSFHILIFFFYWSLQIRSTTLYVFSFSGIWRANPANGACRLALRWDV